ncbi:proline racemase family protein [Fulvivirga ulvae]|uniref:proline racemase family protein n=1 Tax=Fulvivirga ulvae TaxID=2904245 RepID=UPI001F24574C|nr:proline racemase family protein [Fulvivirga ulvae]UII34654.1 proline racemase family protein [Fulvivirga ulvae]
MSSSTFQRIKDLKSFKRPATWSAIKTIEMHTGGEPLRVVVDGFPSLEGDSLLANRRYVKENYDHLRKLLMFEPRGHADMYGCIMLPPFHEEADFSVIFMHNEGYSTMCGHAVIALTKLAVEMGWVEIKEPITSINIEAPCGLVRAYAQVEEGRVIATGFHGVPSFVLADNVQIDVKGMGKLKMDIAYGGAFYAYVDAQNAGIELIPENYPEIIEAGRAIKQAVINSGLKIEHPFEADLGFLYGTIFMDTSPVAGVDSRNVCVFADGEVDRSPTGSGVSGRMALHHQQGILKEGESMTIESIVGSRFTGKVTSIIKFGPYDAVIPEVWGTAHISGQNEFYLDPDDPFQEGFLLR